jgi:hypothetical protein
MIRRVGAIFFVVLFVLGTATTLFVFQPSAASVPVGTAGNSNIPSTAGNAIQPNVATQPVSDTGNAAQANDLVKQGDDAANAGKWTDAIGFYSAALGLSSGNASAEYSLGKAYVQTKQYDKAIEHLQKSVDLNPSATFAGDAQNLINTYKGQVTPGSTPPASDVTPTAANTATSPTPSTK